MSLPSRDSVFQLLQEYTQNPSLIKHALGVEAAMRHYARLWGEDEAKWGLVGLIHDFDYERWPSPEDHPYRGVEILRQRGYPEEICRAVLSHANYAGVPRQTRLEKALFACDELSGFVTAVALVRPSRSIHEVDVRAVRKKMKDKAFAKGVHREDIVRGAEELKLDLDEHISHVIEALKPVAAELGIEGAPADATAP